MPRKKRGSGKDKDVEIMEIKRQHDKEKMELINKPTDIDPTIDRDIQKRLQNLLQDRFKAIEKHNDIVDRIEKQVKLMEKSKAVDLREFIGTLMELRRSLDSWTKSMDDLIKQHYTPDANIEDNRLEIIIRHEAE